MQQKAEWLDFIKVFGVLATLFLHSNSTLVNFQTSVVSYPVELNMTYWNISVVFASLAGPSFALIFMYLGATVLTSHHNSFSFYLQKSKLLFTPLLFWSLFALFFQKYMMHWDISIFDKLTHIIFTPVANNLTILYLLIFVFILTPIVKNLTIHRSTKQQYSIAIIWLTIMTILLSLERYFQLPFPFILFMSIGYLGFMQFGYLLSKTTLNRRLLYIGLLLFFIGHTSTIIGTIYYSHPEQIVQGFYANYYFNRISIPMIFSSLGSFILLRFMAEHLMRSSSFSQIINNMGSIALGMCMVYPYWFIILGTEKTGIEITAFSGNPLWSVPLTALLTIIASYITVYSIKKIPYLHHITPKLY